MNAIEIMKANRKKYYEQADAKAEELLKAKAHADKCLEGKDYVWLEVNLSKMIEYSREIRELRERAMTWETAILILRAERNAECPEKTVE